MPLPTFTTPRLTLRPLVTADSAPLFALIYADEAVRRHFTTISDQATAAAAHQRQVSINADGATGGFGYWTVLESASGTIMGKILLGPPESVTRWITLAPDSCTPSLGDETELGYAFGRRFWGQGYAAEACTPLITYAFDTLGLSRLVNNVRRANPASIRLMERLGFRMEANHWGNDAYVVGVLTPRTVTPASSS